MGRLAANKGNGVCISTSSALVGAAEPIDYVLVPPPPGTMKPFVNTANLDDAIAIAPTVFINKKHVVLKRSIIPTSKGAPPNGIMGIQSKKPPNGEAEFISASNTVFANGSPVVRHRDTTWQNCRNIVGGVKLKDAFSLADSGITLDPAMGDVDKERYVKDLEKLYERPRSRELLDTIRNEYNGRIAAGLRGNPIELSNRLNGALVAIDDAQANAVLNAGQLAADEYNGGPGLGSIVSMPPGSSYTQDGYGVIPSEIVLAHELVHSLWAARGLTAVGSTLGSGARRATQNWELQAMGIGDQSNARIAESRFAEERGLAVRKSHGPIEGNHKFNPDAKSVAPASAATGSAGEQLVYVND